MFCDGYWKIRLKDLTLPLSLMSDRGEEVFNPIREHSQYGHRPKRHLMQYMATPFLFLILIQQAPQVPVSF